MKYIILIVLFFSLIGCSSPTSSNPEENFQIVYQQGSDFTLEVLIVKDNQTDIEYIVIDRGYGAGICQREKTY